MSNKKQSIKFLSVLAGFMLITATALTFTGCQDKQQDQESPSASASLTSESDQVQVSFKFKVVDAEGKETDFDISTTEKTVGAALIEEGLIEGEESEFGLYVKKVNGITADFDADGTYWAFYIGDTYASTGVDSTDITEGETYAFKIEK